MQTFEAVVSALVYSLAAEIAPGSTASRRNDAAAFTIQQHARMAGYLREPLRAATLAFDLATIPLFGARFRFLSSEKKRAAIDLFRNSIAGPFRDLIRFYESLASLGILDESSAHPRVEAPIAAVRESALPPRRCEVLVIGSGPGGAVTAAILAEAGKQVVILEEGRSAPHEIKPFSAQEMAERYRNGGLTPALGSTKIAYVEGRCVGGGSEINSGLYHRTPPEILEEWRTQYRAEISEESLLPHFEACERDLSISTMLGELPAASLRLHEGATRLGWKSLEVPRWFRYGSAGDEPANAQVGQRQTMSRTYLPRAIASGAQLCTGVKVTRLRADGKQWLVDCESANGRQFSIEAETVFLAAGAIQTPFLMRSSGITQNIGEQLQMHPTVKAVARFSDEVNREDLGVPVHQVKEFAPLISLGCSISTPPYLALGMLDSRASRVDVLSHWKNAAVYYAMIKPEGRGSIRAMAGSRDPLVRFKLTNADRHNLGTALQHLGEALLSAGATELFPSITHSDLGSIKSLRDLRRLPAQIGGAAASLMTIHLFSSCPMGEDRARCATDSFGKVHGQRNLYISDASLLPTAPGVNPQGSIMAIARRNAYHFLRKD